MLKDPPKRSPSLISTSRRNNSSHRVKKLVSFDLEKAKNAPFDKIQSPLQELIKEPIMEEQGESTPGIAKLGDSNKSLLGDRLPRL